MPTGTWRHLPDHVVADSLAVALAQAGLMRPVFRSVEPAWPHEGCGFVFERDGVLEVVPTENRAQALHERDPERYPRGGADWFEPDMKPWLRAMRDGAIARVIYHSHPEVGAYFSEGDHASAVVEVDGQVRERHPGVAHLVVSVRRGRADGAVMFRFDESSGQFVEVARFGSDGELDSVA